MKSSIKLTTLKKNNEIKKIAIKGKILSSNEFKFRFLKNKINEMRFAISVNKKIFNTAVLRNKVKRQIRAIIRQIEQFKEIDLLIIVSADYLKNDFFTNKTNFLNLFNKIK